jgi:hypothetical protein
VHRPMVDAGTPEGKRRCRVAPSVRGNHDLQRNVDVNVLPLINRISCL